MVGVRSDAEFAQLQSQVRLRDRLITQIRFSAKLICITGRGGAGKSSLASAILERAEFANHALLSVSGNDDARLRRELLPQLINEPLFNQADPLFDSFKRNVSETHAPLIIIIDDAHRLSAELLRELLEFYQHYNQLYQHALSLILLAEEGHSFSPQLEALSADVLYFDVPPLSENESIELASLLFNRAEYVAEFENQQAIEQHIASAKGNPRLIYQFVDQIVTGDIPMSEARAPNRTKLYIAIVVILCAGVAGLLVQLVNDWGQEQTGSESRIALALMEEPTTLANGSVTAEAPVSSTTQADTAELPSLDVATELDVTTESSDKQLRVVVEGDVVNQLMAEQSQPDTKPDLANNIADNANLLVEPEPDPQPQPEPELPSALESAEPSLPGGAEPVAIQVTDVKSLLDAKPSKHYTLQLMALKNRDKAQQFVSSRQWSHEVWVYRSAANPNVPYKIIYGDFATREQAQAARNQLKQQNLDSLIKQFSQVQFELKK